MSFTLSIPTSSGASMQLDLATGESLFVVGANGTGKSSLMHRIYTQHPAQSRRISAHRQTWFSSNAITLSPDQKRQTETNIKGQDTNPQARWMDDYSAQRASIAIYDLIDAENVRARSIAAAVDEGNIDLAKERSTKDAPLKIINELLRLSNIPIEVSVRQNEQVLASRRGSNPYSVAELSDGERNALLIAANVLTVPAGTLLLVDEPERHLHRSIISPLLTLLFAKRSDCVFVVSTHDVMLPLDNPKSKTLLIRDCLYESNYIRGWDADLLDNSSEIDERLKQDILGSRRRVLFVEGIATSLDAPLYSLLFPNVSVIPKASCRDVINAVGGIRGSATLHWVRAFGLIDNDRRAATEIEELKQAGVHALDLFAVESLYYHTGVQHRLAIRHSALTGGDPSSRVHEATERALAALSAHQQRLCERVVERSLRNAIEKRLPTSKDIATGLPFSVVIDVKEAVRLESESFSEAVRQRDLQALISRYPVRETPALTEIARLLGFQSRDQYEAATRKMLMDDPHALEFVRGLFGVLNAQLQNA